MERIAAMRGPASDFRAFILMYLVVFSNPLPVRQMGLTRAYELSIRFSWRVMTE
jgi:hypothetical protein